MDEVPHIDEETIKRVSAATGFDQRLLIQDYYVTAMLYLLRDVQGIYFKGGTALNKIFLDYARLSEDVDFTVVKDVENVEKEIAILVKESPLFHELTHDKRVHKFVRMIAHYKGPLGSEGTVFIDLNERAKTVLKEENHKIPHYYPENIPPFSVTTLAKKEMMAEKMAATIGRNKPRDHFDLYMILKHKHDIDLDIVAKKCVKSGDEFDIVKMFNRAKKLKNRWDQDLGPLLVDRITFQEVMKVLAKHFKLKEEKEKRKNDRED